MGNTRKIASYLLLFILRFFYVKEINTVSNYNGTILYSIIKRMCARVRKRKERAVTQKPLKSLFSKPNTYRYDCWHLNKVTLKKPWVKIKDQTKTVANGGLFMEAMATKTIDVVRLGQFHCLTFM